MFETLVAESLDCFPDAERRAVSLPADIAELSLPMKQGAVTIRNDFARIGGRYELRGLHIHSPKIEVVTVFLFPEALEPLPVYGMEMVLLAGRPIVGVLDAVCLYTAEPEAPCFLAKLRASTALPYSDDQPDWFVECRSGHELFLRPEQRSDLETLGRLHLQALRLMAATPARKADFCALRHEQAITSYKAHHHENSPGLPLMNSVFGKEWTTRYMSDYLFA